MRVDMSPAAITARLQRVSDLADLRPERRLDHKIDMSPQAITDRLRRVDELNRLCQTLGALPSTTP
jgi:hypothetical protein